MGEPRDQNRFLVRMPDGMRDYIRKMAEKNNRSMNSEIVDRLQTTIELEQIMDEADRLPLDPFNRELAEQRRFMMSVGQDIKEMLAKMQSLLPAKDETAE